MTPRAANYTLLCSITPGLFTILRHKKTNIIPTAFFEYRKFEPLDFSSSFLFASSNHLSCSADDWYRTIATLSNGPIYQRRHALYPSIVSSGILFIHFTCIRRKLNLSLTFDWVILGIPLVLSLQRPVYLSFTYLHNYHDCNIITQILSKLFLLLTYFS